MKLRNRLPLIKRKCTQWLNQKGQTLVEFVLLLAVVSSISYAFVSVVNTNIGRYWTHCVNLVVNDGNLSKPDAKKLTIE